MMNSVHNVAGSGISLLPDSMLTSIESIRAAGAAQEWLHHLFGVDQMQVLGEGTAAAPIGIGIATDKGLRQRNEDSAIIITGKTATGSARMPVALAAVADGMGGHAQGDLASGLAITTLVEYAIGNFFPTNDGHNMYPEFDSSTVADMLTDGMTQAHSAVRRGIPDGGCTLTCVLLLDDMLFVAHVGDSRAYLVKAGSIDILTHDHRLIRQMQNAGILTSDEAAHHPQRHVLFRALGMDDELEVDVTRKHIRSTSRLLLCTDGVWEPLSAKDIYMWVVLGQSPQDICERLIRDATVRQSNDNATAVLLHIPFP